MGLYYNVSSAIMLSAFLVMVEVLLSLLAFC